MDREGIVIVKQRTCQMDYPYLLDLVTDNVMSRTLTMLITFLLFAFTVFVIVGSSDAVHFCYIQNRWYLLQPQFHLKKNHLLAFQLEQKLLY